MAFTVIYDANVLYPSVLRDVLIRVARAGLVQARWTNEILDEVFHSLATNRPDLDSERLQRTRELMCAAVRDCIITGYEPIIPSLQLPDPNDRHVLAAAITTHAEVIVTFNIKDFPRRVLEPLGIETKDPDEFLLNQIDLDAITMHKAVQSIADACRNPPLTVNDVLDRLEAGGMVRTAAMLRR